MTGKRKLLVCILAIVASGIAFGTLALTIGLSKISYAIPIIAIPVAILVALLPLFLPKNQGILISTVLFSLAVIISSACFLGLGTIWKVECITLGAIAGAYLIAIAVSIIIKGEDQAAKNNVEESK